MSGHRASGDAASPTSGGTSRRTALKAGVGLGVGAVAWSGGSITSLGGTPAYASGCTFVLNLELLSCRNTDQGGSSQFRYHQLKDPLETGYDLVNNIAEGTPCTDNHVTTFTFPAGITCKVQVKFNRPSQCTGTFVGSLVFGPDSSGSLPLTLSCITPVTPQFYPNTQYQVFANCNTTGAPLSCL